jgi:mRNA export factor
MTLFYSSDVNFTFKCHRETVEGKPSRARSRVDQESKSLVNVWAVNDIQFHPVHTRTLVTAGSNGAFCFWDVGAHSRLRSYPPASTTSTSTSTATSSSFFDKIINKEPSDTNTPPPSLTASAFSRDGTFYSYAIGYDWCWGCSSNSPQIETKVMLHRVLDDDAKPKKKSILIR